MTKVCLYKLSIFCDDHLMNFKSLFSIHTYPTQNAHLTIVWATNIICQN